MTLPISNDLRKLDEIFVSNSKIDIFRPQLTSILSISHRVSGVGWGVCK